MKAYIYLLFLPFIILSCSENSNKKTESTDKKIDQYKIYTYEVTPNEWGYEILEYDQTIINQPFIPAISGNKGFSSEKNAVITASFMVDKLRNGINPPTVSIQELDSLGVLNP